MNKIYKIQVHTVYESNYFTLNINENTTFNSIINQIGIKNALYVKIYNSSANYKIIHPRQYDITLKNYNVQQDNIIKFIPKLGKNNNNAQQNNINKFIPKLEKNMQIFYKNEFTNVTQTITVYPSTLIKDVKSKIFKYEGIPVDKQNLYYGLHRLDNERCISDYNITKEMTIRVTGRLLSCNMNDIKNHNLYYRL